MKTSKKVLKRIIQQEISLMLEEEQKLHEVSMAGTLQDLPEMYEFYQHAKKAWDYFAGLISYVKEGIKDGSIEKALFPEPEKKINKVEKLKSTVGEKLTKLNSYKQIICEGVLENLETQFKTLEDKTGELHNKASDLSGTNEAWQMAEVLKELEQTWLQGLKEKGPLHKQISLVYKGILKLEELYVDDPNMLKYTIATMKKNGQCFNKYGDISTQQKQRRTIKRREKKQRAKLEEMIYNQIQKFIRKY